MVTSLLLFPAMAQDAHAYDLVDLPASRTVVYPGHGDDRRSAHGMSLADLADDAMAGVDGEVDVVGVALGGIVAQHVIARHGPRVRSALLANTPGGVSSREPLIARAASTREHGPDADELLARWLRPSTVARNGPAVAYVRRLLAEISWDALADVQRAMADHDVFEALEGDPRPVTFVVGEDDGVGAGATERLAGVFENRRLRRIPGGHMVHLDNPRDFGALVHEHLRWAQETRE